MTLAARVHQGEYKEIYDKAGSEGPTKLGRAVFRGAAFGAAALLVVLACQGNMSLRTAPRATHGAARKLMLPLTNVVRPLEEVQFRVPPGTAPGSLIHVLVPGELDPRAVQVPAGAKPGEMLAVRVSGPTARAPSLAAAPEEGAAEAADEKAESGVDNEVEDGVEKVMEEVEEDVELTVPP